MFIDIIFKTILVSFTDFRQFKASQIARVFVMEKIVESGPDIDESDGFPCEDKAALQVPQLPLGRDRKKGTPSMMRSISIACNNLGQDEESKVEEPRGISPTNANAEMRRFMPIGLVN